MVHRPQARRPEIAATPRYIASLNAFDQSFSLNRPRRDC
jgi:hypothetical protein